MGPQEGLTLHHALATILSMSLITFAACGPSASSSSSRRTAARPAAPKKCPKLTLSKKLLKQKTLTRRIRKLVCGLQSCFEDAQSVTKDPGAYMRLSVTIDRGGRIEGIRLAAKKVPASLTKCVRSKVLRWDFDIRDDSFTYGPFKIKFAP